MQFDLGKAIVRIVAWMKMYGVKVTVTELLPEKDAVLIFRDAKKHKDTRPVKDMYFRDTMSVSLSDGIRMIVNRREGENAVTVKIVNGKDVLARKHLSIDEYVQIARYFNGDDE